MSSHPVGVPINNLILINLNCLFITMFCIYICEIKYSVCVGENVMGAILSECIHLLHNLEYKAHHQHIV